MAVCGTDSRNVIALCGNCSNRSSKKRFDGIPSTWDDIEK